MAKYQKIKLSEMGLIMRKFDIILRVYSPKFMHLQQRLIPAAHVGEEAAATHTREALHLLNVQRIDH